MRIRIATKALPGLSLGAGQAPESLDQVAGGYRIPWVELNGHRFEDITDAQVTVGFGSHDTVVTRLAVGLIDPVELVYLGKDGTEIGAVAVEAPQLPHEMDAQTMMPNPRDLLDRGAEVVVPPEPCRIQVSTTERMSDPDGAWVAWVEIEGTNASDGPSVFGGTRGEALRNLATMLDSHG